MGEIVTYSHEGKEWSGYLASGPEGAPGVILVQEWWGLVGHIKAVADRLAAEGFTVLAPDFYHGEMTAEPDVAGSLMMSLQVEDASQLIFASVSHLKSLGCQGGIGAIGFCMGGQLSLFAACLTQDIKACIDFYGIHPDVKPDLAALQAPLLGIFAEHDDYASPQAVADLSDRLSALSKVHEFKTYMGVHHAFFNDERPSVYDPEAAGDAWERVLRHLRSNLP
jgi:carboxymethylenebutenolidase